MEKIKVSDVVGQYSGDGPWNLLSHAILGSIGGAHCMQEILDGMKGEGEERYMEVEFRINGQEVHFSRFMDHLSSEVQRLIKVEGQRQIEEKASDLEDLVYQLKKEILDLAQQRLGVNLEEDS